MFVTELFAIDTIVFNHTTSLQPILKNKQIQTET